MWKDIPGYEGLYQASDSGHIRSVDRFDIGGNKIKGVVLKQRSARGGYLRVGLWKDGVMKTTLVHRAIAAAYVPNPEAKPQVNHVDENKENNTAENLEWVSCKENVNHGTRNARIVANSDRVGAAEKLRKSVIQMTIEDKVVAKWPSIRSAARATGINNGSISNCCRGIKKSTHGFKWALAEEVA